MLRKIFCWLPTHHTRGSEVPEPKLEELEFIIPPSCMSVPSYQSRRSHCGRLFSPCTTSDVRSGCWSNKVSCTKIEVWRSDRFYAPFHILIPLGAANWTPGMPFCLDGPPTTALNVGHPHRLVWMFVGMKARDGRCRSPSKDCYGTFFVSTSCPLSFGSSVGTVFVTCECVHFRVRT